MTTNVLPGAEDGYCGPIVRELHRIANDLIDIASFELPEPRQFELNIQPGGESDEEIIEAVNAIGLALLNKKGEHSTTNSNPWYSVKGSRGAVSIAVYRSLAKVPDGRDDLGDQECRPEPRFAASGLTLAADQSRGPLAGTTPVVTYFSFGSGQHDPDSGKDLYRHYVTVVAPTYEECREAMFASRYGREWSHDYLAGRERTTALVSLWTEHEVIVAPGTDPDHAEAALEAARDVLAASAE